MSPPLTPTLPADHRLYAIGDIHGSIDPLKKLLELIRADSEAAPEKTKVILFLGDYIDRGLYSKEVIDTLLHHLPPGMEPVFLRGNHDDALLRFLEGDTNLLQAWLSVGGTSTLASYGVNVFRSGAMGDAKTILKEFSEHFPQEHLDFLKDTIFSFRLGDYLFVHAGIKPGVPWEKQTNDDMMWIRGEFLSSDRNHGKMIVHGHSVTLRPDIKPNRIGVDTGAFATGTLTCLVLSGNQQGYLNS